MNHPLSLKWLGMHGTVYANNAVNEADVLLAMGVRFDDRVTGKVEKFAEHGTIVHVDFDASEINKNKVVRLPIISDVKLALQKLNALLAKAGWERKATGEHGRYPAWYAAIQEWKAKYPLRFNDTEGKIQPPVRHPAPQRTDARRGHRHDRRGPAPDVGGPILRLPASAQLHHLGGPGRDGLRLPCGDGRESGLSGA